MIKSIIIYVIDENLLIKHINMPYLIIFLLYTLINIKVQNYKTKNIIKR